MQYPSFAEYSEALQASLARALSDPLLARGTLRLHGPGQPVAHSGSFALTFEVSVDGKTYAVRCFHKYSDSLHERYRAIGELLRSIRSPHFVDFDFQPSGITTESGTYPIVRMEWAEGPTLASFVANRHHDAAALQQLRASLRMLAAHLKKHGIAHGDIQPSNIILQGTGDLRLIDYDGMFVPGLAPMQSAELGQRNFQHPWRRPWHFDAGLDAFAFALSDLALDALCRRPELWDETGSDTDAFILRADDLADPAGSPVFKRLASVPGLQKRVKRLAAICVSPYDRIPSFEDFLAGRHIPPVAVVFSGKTALPSRRTYVSVNEIVDGSNFARCCSHVGDRVELIGKVVRVAMNRVPHLDADCLRVEFAEHSHDMVCLKIWPDARAALDAVPDESWVGQWVSAVGLVDPVHSIGDGEQRQKDVSISIADQSQLQRLTQDEARYRLRGYRGQGHAALDMTGAVRTDRVVTEAAPRPTPVQPPPPAPVPPPPPVLLAPVNIRAGRESRPRRTRWLAATIVGALAVFAFVSMRDSSEELAGETGLNALVTGESSRPRAAPKAELRPAWQRFDSRLESQEDLDTVGFPVKTAAGMLDLGTRTESGRPLLLGGKPVLGLRDDAITLAHRTVFSDREIIVGFTRCEGAAFPCGVRQPFWLELRSGLPPNAWLVPGLWVSTGAGEVTASEAGVRVELGMWNGERRNATLTAAGNVEVARTREPVQPLDRDDCATVARSAEACAASRDCSSFEASAQLIPSATSARLNRLYHESTGFDAAAFRDLCVQSCQLGLTPSRGFIRRHVCSGAPPGQWSAYDSAASLVD